METSMDPDWDVITESAIDVVTTIDDGRIKIGLDLSYDNGIIIKENRKEHPRRVDWGLKKTITYVILMYVCTKKITK